MPKEADRNYNLISEEGLHGSLQNNEARTQLAQWREEIERLKRKGEASYVGNYGFPINDTSSEPFKILSHLSIEDQWDQFEGKLSPYRVGLSNIDQLPEDRMRERIKTVTLYHARDRFLRELGFGYSLSRTNLMVGLKEGEITNGRIFYGASSVDKSVYLVRFMRNREKVNVLEEHFVHASNEEALRVFMGIRGVSK